MLRGLFVSAIIIWGHLAISQPKTLTAVKTQQAIVVDGKLDDPAWRDASLATDFIQNSPLFGSPASAKTEVRFLYDDNAVYVSAYLHDDPLLIRKQITARDGEQRQDVDYFSVAFDTYNDHQNGFLFLITPANVQTDSKITSGSIFNYGMVTGDSRTWDAVWQSNVQQVSDGWTVELRIPYISLRFAKKDVQTWGLQFIRFTRRNNEVVTWNPVNPNESGFINQFGNCDNLVDIKPPLRLSFSPYVTGGVRFYPDGSDNKSDFLRNGGMDVKYGINESFTLDATLIPDFGQTISDNLINNLTPFEVRFNENRPFFTEGTELFNKANLFYSRRIGAIPANYLSVDGLRNFDYTILNNPSVTQLYNAIKLSGRTKNKLGIGVFNAVTAPTHARVRYKLTGKDSTIETESLTNYNIFVLDQALRGRSSITFTNTNVIRNGADRDANVTGLDYNYFTKNNQYQFKVSGRYSNIFGYTPYTGNINLVNDTARINGQLMVKPYDGFRSNLAFNKVSGKIQFNFSTNISSNTYDPNDLGFLQKSNEISYAGLISFNQLTATDKFIIYSYLLGLQYFSLYKPYAYNSFEIYVKGRWVLKNFWDFNMSVGGQPYSSNDYFELRTPNRYLRRPAFRYINIGGSTDSRKKFFVGSTIGLGHTEIENGTNFFINYSSRYRFSNRFSLNLDINTQNDQTQVGYAFQRETNGEPIIGYRRYVETESILSGIYNFTSRLNLTMRARHYWNEVKYKSFFNVAPDGSHLKRPFIANQNDNYNLFNLDAFLTWDFRLGSRLIFGYKNWLGNPNAVVSQPRGYFSNFGKIFNSSHGNELTVKFIYFLDYNQLRKKH